MHHHVLRLVALLVAGFSVSFASNAGAGRLGCYEDTVARVWKMWDNTHQFNSVEFCNNMCQDFKYAGLQAGQWCMCGDNIPPKALPDSKCNSPCSGNPKNFCGGAWALDVFPVVKKPVIVGEPMGCFQDAVDRVWKNGIIKFHSNTPQRCFNACRGFRYAGLQNSIYCMCGDTMPSTPLPKESCQDQCNGYIGKTCGGSYALEVFELSEVPDPVHVVGNIPKEYKPKGNLGIYKTYIERKTWDEAWQQCENDNAHLLILNSVNEAKFVRTIFAQLPSETRMHAGFHDLLHKGNYRTLFGKTLPIAGYNIWSKQHPAVTSPVQHCGCLDTKAQLAQIDGNCATPAVFMCEKKSKSPDVNKVDVQIDVRGILNSTGLVN